MASNVELPDDESDLSGYEDSDGDIDLECSQERPNGSDSEVSSESETETETESELSQSQNSSQYTEYSTESDAEFIDNQGWGRLNVSHGHPGPGNIITFIEYYQYKTIYHFKINSIINNNIHVTIIRVIPLLLLD